jgi:hypothetical protein
VLKEIAQLRPVEGQQSFHPVFLPLDPKQCFPFVRKMMMVHILCLLAGSTLLSHQSSSLPSRAATSCPAITSSSLPVFLRMLLADIRHSGIVIAVEQDAVLRLISVAPAAKVPIGNLLVSHKRVHSRRQAIETAKPGREDVEFNFSHGPDPLVVSG